MTRITNADQVMLLLHEQLERLAKGRGKRLDSVTTGGSTPAPLDRLHTIAGGERLLEQELKHMLVRGLLTQQLGEAVAGDPSFEAVATDVLRIIDASPAGQDLIARALAQLGCRSA